MTNTHDILARPDATPEQWATLAEHIATQPDPDYLADILGLERAMHDQSAGIDRRTTRLHPRRSAIAGRKS